MPGALASRRAITPLMAVFASLALAAFAFAEMPDTIVGAEVATFFVRDVASPNPAAASCLVCRYGARPVVMICGRHIDKQVTQLLKSMSAEVDRHRGEGLKAFGVFVSEEGKPIQPRLMSLVRRNDVTFPLTMPVENVAGPRELRLLDNADTTVLFYIDRHVAACYKFSAGQIGPAQIEQLQHAAGQLAAGEAIKPQPAVEQMAAP